MLVPLRNQDYCCQHAVMVPCLNNTSNLLTNHGVHKFPLDDMKSKHLSATCHSWREVQVLPVHPGATNKISEVHTKENEGNILYHKRTTEIWNHWQTLVNTVNNSECYINNNAFLFNHKKLNNQQNTLFLVVKTTQCLVYFAGS